MATVRKRQWKRKDGATSSGWICEWSDEKGKEHRKLFSTKRDADAFRIEIENQLLTGSYRSIARELSVADLATRYLAHCQERMKRGERMTRHNLSVYKGHINKHILGSENGIGAYKLSELSTSQVAKFRDRLRSSGVSVPTTRKIISTLHSVLEYATTHDLIARNPAKNIRVLGNRAEQSKKIKSPSKTDITTLVNQAEQGIALKVMLAATTGVRAGEFHALRWRHFDLVQNTVSIETRVDAYGIEDVPKTNAGIRTIPLSSDIACRLKAWRMKSAFSSGNDLVFPNKKGGYENHDNMVKRQFKPLFSNCREAHETDPQNNPEPPVYFNWHALRHFAISCWIEAGLSPKTIQTFAGHSSLQVTMDRYGHLFPSEMHQSVMDEIVSSIFS